MASDLGIRKLSLRQLITSVLLAHGESWDDVHSIAYGNNVRRLTDDEEVEAVLEKRAYRFESFGRSPFVIWTASSLYVPHVNDGKFEIVRLPRNPDADFIPMQLGGGW